MYLWFVFFSLDQPKSRLTAEGRRVNLTTNNEKGIETMDLLFPAALRIITAVALIYFGLGLFNIHWLMRVRAIAALSVGALLVGAVGWPLVRPELPVATITLVNGSISLPGAIGCVLLAFAAGFIAFFVSWPAGKILAPYAAPTGLAIWAMFSGNMHQLLLDHYEPARRETLYAALRWEGFFWLLICAAGYLGVLAASRLVGAKILILGQFNSDKPKGTAILTNILLAMGITLVVSWVAVGIFVQDIHQVDPELGTVVGQPGNRQIAFGVFTAFCISAYLVKYTLKIGYLPVAAASVLLTFGGSMALLRGQTLSHLAGNWPIAYFNHVVNAITPLQMVAFAVLGSITGYWMAVKFHHLSWQTH